MNSLFRAFRRLHAGEPDRRVLQSRPGGRWMTLNALHRRAVALASELEGRGFRRGQICAVSTGSHPLFVVSVLAVWSLEGILLPLEERLPRKEREACMETFGPAFSIRRAGHRPVVEEIFRERGLRHPGACKIRLTSGSTGAPRGALVTSAQMTADGKAVIGSMGITPDDLNVAALPLGHSYGFDNVVLPLVLQGTAALLLEAPLPSLILTAFRSRRPLVFPSVPYLLDLLARHPDPPPSPSGLRLCISAGAPLPAATAAAFRERFGVGVHSFYGASEAGGIAFQDGDEAAAEGCVGTPMAGVEIAIDRKGLGHLPPGEGRVIVRGPAVARGYVPQGAADLSNGRFRTSDLGRMDEAGRLHLTGRVSSLVNVSGKKVNPAEVERVLLRMEGVEDAVVLGVRDALRGERVEAWVVTAHSRTTDSIRRELAAGLSAWKVPRTIHDVPAIPRTERGKIDRVRLLGAPGPGPTSRRPTPRH